MPSNGFENALVFCFILLVKIGIPLHLFDLGLESVFLFGRLDLNSPLVFQEIIS